MSTATTSRRGRRKAQETTPEPIVVEEPISEGDVSTEELQDRINSMSDQAELETFQKHMNKLRKEEESENEQAENTEPIPFEETEAFKRAQAETAALRAEIDARRASEQAALERERAALDELTEEKKKVRYPEDPPVTPYIVAHHFEWIEAEEGSSIEGFKIKVRTSITNFEKRKLNEKDDWLEKEYSPLWQSTPREERKNMKSPREYQRELIAPYIYEWNAQGMTESGEIEPIPAPREYGPDVFDFIGEEEYEWLAYVVLGGYTVTGKAGSWLDALRNFGSPLPEEENQESESTNPTN